MAETLMEVRGLKKYYPVETGLLAKLFGNQQFVHAVDDIDLDINQGEIIGLAGESGCGKTTVARCLMHLDEPTDGDIYFGIGDEKRNIAELDKADLQSYRQDAQIIYQDPYESINDRFTVRKWVREPLRVHGIGDNAEQERRTRQALEQSGLRPVDDFLHRYPHELSGGQRQRVAMARSLILNPSFIVADEPTSMLDVSVRAGILRLFKDLVEEQNITILYISHDLSLLRYICDRIAVMYQGEIAEIGHADRVLQEPKHPYTEALVSAVPRVNPEQSRERVRIPGEVKERIGGIQGCSFKHRCPYRFDKCDEDPPLIALGDEKEEQKAACHLHDESVDK